MGKINMLVIKNDRLQEINKQMRKAAIKKDWTNYYMLKKEKEDLMLQIKNIESKESISGR